MKKLFFSLIATVMISSFAIANTNEMKENDFIENQESILTKTEELNEDDVWFCIACRKKKLKNDEVKGEGYILNSILYSLFYGFCDF